MNPSRTSPSSPWKTVETVQLCRMVGKWQTHTFVHIFAYLRANRRIFKFEILMEATTMLAKTLNFALKLRRNRKHLNLPKVPLSRI